MLCTSGNFSNENTALLYEVLCNKDAWDRQVNEMIICFWGRLRHYRIAE